jgi:hypothetical protein
MLSSNLVSIARLAAGRRLDFAPKCRGACKEDRLAPRPAAVLAAVGPAAAQDFYKGS